MKKFLQIICLCLFSFIVYYHYVEAGTFTLYKYDANTKRCQAYKQGGKIKTGVFKLYKSDNTYVADLKIDNNCTAFISDLDYGNYYIEESETGFSYLPNDQKYYFDINDENEDYTLTVYSKLKTGKIQIELTDSKTNDCTSISPFASLNGTEGYIYYRLDPYNNVSVEKFKFQNNCLITSGNLAFGNYFIQITQPAPGYKLDRKNYYFSITQENVDDVPIIPIQSEIYGSNIHLNNTYKGSTLVDKEGAIFDIYLANSLEKYQSMTTNEQGEATIWLPYGNYIMKQIHGPKNYYLAEDKTIEINEQSEEDIYLTVENEPYKAKLKLENVDAKGNPIKIEGVKFKIYDVLNEKYICEEDSNCEYETNENGELITSTFLPTSTYQISQVDQSINGYLWNNLPLQFDIDENSPFIKDQDDNDILVIKFINYAVKGKIIVQNWGEEVKYQNNEIIYNHKLLNKVSIGLYKNNQLIKKAQTDNLGTVIFDDLELGNYEVRLLDINDNYIENKQKYFVTLKYLDQYTEEVTNNLNIKNYLFKGFLTIINQDNITEKGIVGSKFAILDENQKQIYLGTTNKDGQIEIENLPLGKYYIKEELNDSNYVPNLDLIAFSITKNKDKVIIKINSELLKVEDKEEDDNKQDNEILDNENLDNEVLDEEVLDNEENNQDSNEEVLQDKEDTLDREEIISNETIKDEQENLEIIEETEENDFEEVKLNVPNTKKNKSIFGKSLLIIILAFILCLRKNAQKN